KGLRQEFWISWSAPGEEQKIARNAHRRLVRPASTYQNPGFLRSRSDATPSRTPGLPKPTNSSFRAMNTTDSHPQTQSRAITILGAQALPFPDGHAR